MRRLIIFVMPLFLLPACGLQNGVDPEPYFDKDIPPSEAFDASYGVWNTDGTQIAFQHDDPLGSTPDAGKLDQLWIYNTETGKRWNVMDGRVQLIDWGPENKKFLFNTRLGASTSGYLYKVNLDGQNLQKLTGEGSPNDKAYTVGGRWSPDGSSILFTIVAGEPRGISLMNLDGTNLNIIIPYGVAASWFPAGDRIVYANWDMSVKDDTQRRQLYIANSDGSNAVKITNLKHSDLLSEPNVSPDGNKIAFVHRGRDSSMEIFVMQKDGSHIEQLTEGDGMVRRPEWHPDGREILFTRIIPNVSERMYLLDVQTRQVEPVFPAE